MTSEIVVEEIKKHLKRTVIENDKKDVKEFALEMLFIVHDMIGELDERKKDSAQ